MVNSMLDAIDGFHANSLFAVLLRELSVFLTVVTGTQIDVAPDCHRDWIIRRDPDTNEVFCELGKVGYLEIPWPTIMPQKGTCPPVPYRSVTRPDFSIRGIGEENEEDVPDDIIALWHAFEALPPDRRRQFIQVGNMWQLALSIGRDHQTARFARWFPLAKGSNRPTRNSRTPTFTTLSRVCLAERSATH